MWGELMNKVRIIMYHYVRELEYSRYPQIKGLEYRLFKEQIEFLCHNFNIITMEELIAAYEESYELPENAALLTFDDGYADHYSYVFPILNDKKIQGSFYIPGKTFTEGKVLDVNKIHFILASGKIDYILEQLYKLLDFYRGKEFDYASNEELFQQYGVMTRFDSKEVNFVKKSLQTVLPERLRNIITNQLFEEIVGVSELEFAKKLYMNRDQIACMKRNGMFIGLHGYDHYWLGNLTEKEAEADIDKALDCMQDYIDSKKWVLNYPYGSFNENVIETIKKRGCCLAMATECRTAMVPADSRYTLPRLDTNDFPPKSKNYRNM